MRATTFGESLLSMVSPVEVARQNTWQTIGSIVAVTIITTIVLVIVIIIIILIVTTTHLPIQQQTWSHVLEESFCHRSADNATAAEEQQPPHLWNVTTINGKSLKYLNISSFKHFLQIFHIWSRRGKEVSVWLLLPDFADSASRLIPGYTQLILDIWAGHKNTCDFIIV